MGGGLAVVASPGHKLGQLIGNFFEEFFSNDMTKIANKHGFYCDKKGPRPGVRGKKKKVVWTDAQGNEHDLDYVVEKNGTQNNVGTPVAFIELAWRRYTKHSRNKASEIEGSLISLKNTHRLCRFIGAILGGDFTEGALNQMRSRGIQILYIPFNKIHGVFVAKGVNIDYPEDAPSRRKWRIIRAWERLSEEDIKELKEAFANSIKEECDNFIKQLENALVRKVEKIYVFGLFGNEMAFDSIDEAIVNVEKYEMSLEADAKFAKFEIRIKFSNGDEIEGSFRERDEALRFLRQAAIAT